MPDLPSQPALAANQPEAETGSGSSPASVLIFSLGFFVLLHVPLVLAVIEKLLFQGNRVRTLIQIMGLEKLLGAIYKLTVLWWFPGIN